MRKPLWPALPGNREKSTEIGLIGGGAVAEIPLLRIPALAARLGPIKASSFRVASRISNALRAGRPVPDYIPFAPCAIVLIAVPEASLPQTLKTMLTAPFSWEGKTVALISNALGCDRLKDLLLRGALVASIAAVPGFEERWFVLEASEAAAAALRPLLEYRGTRITLIAPGNKVLYKAALLCTGGLLTRVMAASDHMLRESGLTPAHAAALIERQVARALRAYAKGTKSSHMGLEEFIRCIASEDPRVSQILNAVS